MQYLIFRDDDDVFNDGDGADGARALEDADGARALEDANRNVRPAARAHNEALNELWLCYENKELSPRMFLQAVVEMKDGGRLQGD